MLTFNGEPYIGEVLDACLAQEAPFDYEVLVLDSGSTDATLEIVGQRPRVRLHSIPNHEFGHGRTRNLAAQLAGGEIVVFLTQDATPIGDGWLAELVSPLQDDRLAGTFAQHVPRPEARPSAARDVIDAFRTVQPGFFSNVCSAVPKRVLQQIPFRDVSYAEDRQFAADAVAAGMEVAYNPRALVWHSHDLALVPYFRRMYDEARGLHDIGTPPDVRLRWLLGATVRGTMRDWAFIVRHDHYRVPDKLRWLAMAPLYNAARRLAIRLSATKRMPPRVLAALSLEGKRRSKASSRAPAGG